MSIERSKGLLVASVVLLWLLVVGTGMGKLWAFAQTPGPSAHASPLWPTASRLIRDPQRPTLLVFAHPQCACSRATMGELALLLTHAQNRVTTIVLFYKPSKAEAGWDHTDLWSSAAAIPGVQVVSDEDGAQADVFGALSSGQTLLYDKDGRLIFRGGITDARGHSGDNAGRSALESLLNDHPAATQETPVFGCLLSDKPAP